MQNAYRLVTRDDEHMARLFLAEGIAWVPYFPLGGAAAGLPKVTDEPAVIAAARALGVSPAQLSLAWLLHHTPHTLLIPGTADAEHLRANVDAGAMQLDAATVDSVPTHSGTIEADRLRNTP